MKLKIFKTGLALLMVVVMLLSTVGCSMDELSFYNLAKEIAGMNGIETSGSVSVILGSGLVNEIKGRSDWKAEWKSLNDVLASGFDIQYTSKVVKRPLGYEFTVDFRKKGVAEYTRVTTVKGNDKVMYVNLKELLSFAKPYILEAHPSEAKVVNAIQAKVEYLQIDLNKGMSSARVTQSLSDSDVLTRVFTGLTDVFKDAYAGYDTGIVSKVGNGYELKLEAKNIMPAVIKFVEYTVANIDTIAEKATATVNAMSDKDIAVFSEAMHDPSIDKQALLSAVEDFKKEVKETTPEDINELKNDAQADTFFWSIDGSYLSSYLEKAADGTYISTSGLVAKYQGKMFVEVKDSSKLKQLSAYSLVKPAKVVTEKGLQELIKAELPVRVEAVKIDLKTKKATVTYSNKKTVATKIPYYKMKDGNYVSLNAINKVLGTKITWDEKSKSAQVKRNGQLVKLTAKKMSGNAYIRVSDLELIGYYVLDGSQGKTIEIWDNSRQSMFENQY